ncbi:TIR domain-containing protein [Owenweeksia hongkongensis]|uniref:TIR domain-containing protein n=1 Tax=Owenweeksia hongkongensis TaxID=253245 RepID=UPI003A9026A4
MARRVFFSFHYDDVADFRVNVIRKSGVLRHKGNTSKFIDKSLWEAARLKSKQALQEVIDDGLNGCGITALLIGSETVDRKWVRYELVKSLIEGKGILSIHLNRIRSRSTGKISSKGVNPLSKLKLRVDSECEKIYFYELIGRKWFPFELIPYVNNRQKNSVIFSNGGFWKQSQCGREFKFSELFPQEYCWVNDDGYNNFPTWVEKAARQVGR